MTALDWQTIVAIACVTIAAGWWLRRALHWGRHDSSCGTGCGRCSTDGLHQIDLTARPETKRHPHA